MQLVNGLLLGGGLLLHGCAWRLSPQAVSTQADEPERAVPEAAANAELQASALSSDVTYERYALPNSEVHVVTIPPGELRVQVAAAASLATLRELAVAAGAIAAINAGFFDPQNGLTTSHITISGKVVADPRQNDRLVQNPELQAYLPAILNRSEFRVYICAKDVRYDIALHDEPSPSGCTIDAAVGAGPQLLPDITGYEEGFFADNPAGERVRDALGSQTANARSAVGLKADGTVIFAMASQRPQADTPSGLSLAEMAKFLQSLGVQKALNLDGGSSSGLSVNGQTYFGQLDEAGQPIERPIKSILWVR